MKNILKYSIAVSLFFAATSMYAQEGPGKPVVVKTNKLYQHGYSETHNTGPANPKESIDSLTVTSQVNYFVLPDRSTSPDWYDAAGNIKDVSNTTNLNSTFGWSIDNAIGTVTANTSPIVSILWTLTGAVNVKAQETPTGAAACVGSARTIPVHVIPKPTITFNQVGVPAGYEAGACYTAAQIANNEALYDFPITTSTSVNPLEQVEVDYTVTKDGAVTTLGKTNVRVAKGVGSFQIIFDDHGKYVVTITKITDRISRKTKVSGDIVGAGAAFTYNVMKPVETGPIYRIPNNY